MDAAVETGQAPLFLLGAPRSGTTLLYKALCLHPDAVYVSNWLRRFPRLTSLAALNRLAGRFPETRRTVWFGADSNAYVYGARRLWRHRLFPMPVEGEPLFARCGVVQDGVSPISEDAQRAALRQAFSAIRRSGGGGHVISKRIANNRRISLLAGAFPGARFVHIIRDGRAVALSLSRVDWWRESVVSWYGGTPARWEAEGRDPWDLCALEWVENLHAVEDGLRAVPSHRVTTLRYEDVVGAPLDALAQIAAFAGLAARPSWMGELERVRFHDRNRTWADQLSPAALSRIEALQHDDLLRHGYLS